MASLVQQVDFLPFALDSTAIFVLSIVATSLILLTTLVKLWISKIQRLQLLLSDYCAIISSVVLLGSLGIVIYYNAIPMTEPSTADALILPENALRVSYLKANFAVELLWPISLCFSKLSVLLLYRRVFFFTTLRAIGVVTMFLVASLCIATVFGTVFQCSPVNAFWHGNDGNPTCLNRQIFFLATAIINMAVNMMILLLPIYELLRLSIQRSVKIFLWAIFILGAFALAASIVRFIEIAQISGLEAKDSRSGACAAVIVEASIIVLCAYLPTLCPALWKMRPWGGTRSRGRGRNRNQGSSLAQRMFGPREMSEGRFTGGRKWPGGRAPRPDSEFIDPNKSLPSEPINDWISSLTAASRSSRSKSRSQSQSHSLSHQRENSLRGAIHVEETVTTRFDRRSQLFGPPQAASKRAGDGRKDVVGSGHRTFQQQRIRPSLALQQGVARGGHGTERSLIQYPR